MDNMIDTKHFYLTTTLPYVNAAPHIGFALEIVQADILARYWHSLGHDVFFTTGTDEHGQKIYEAAAKAGVPTQEYVDGYAAQFRQLKERLNLSPDLHFVRTTDAGHIHAAQEMWRRCAAQGDIVKRSYRGMYCVGDEAFVKDSDLVDGRCPNHPTMELVELEEENYFFLLSKYQQKLLDYLSQPKVVIPEWRRQEAIQFVHNGLEDFSISRVANKMPWGIPVPDDVSQVMYVWFDALTNYISTLGWPIDTADFQNIWVNGTTYQVAGKDQVRFQSIMWQAMLMSANIPTTQHILYHGFITSGGQKMSKSIGNVIDPITIINEYGIDALRYFLARHIQPFEDSDFTMERFKELYNADLANGLGNLVARIMQLAQKNLGPGEYHPRTINEYPYPKQFRECLDNFKINDAVTYIWQQIQILDERITYEAPFKVVKENPEEGYRMIEKLRDDLYEIARMLESIMPETSEIIQDAMLINTKPANLFARKE
jgi:methionyl-tRNA synthetase